MSLLISASQAARIAGVSHWHLANNVLNTKQQTNLCIGFGKIIENYLDFPIAGKLKFRNLT
jgi:hypothetical protein